jgi:hypothetical protein
MMATGNARDGTPMAKEIVEAPAGFLIGTGQGSTSAAGRPRPEVHGRPFTDAGSERPGRIGRYERLREAVENQGQPAPIRRSGVTLRQRMDYAP